MAEVKHIAPDVIPLGITKPYNPQHLNIEIMKENEIDHEGTQNIVCPYCGYIETDSWEINEDYDENYWCGNSNCGETFTMERIIDVTYNTKK